MTFSEALLPEFDQEMTSTRKILALVPDDQFDYRPHPKSMALGRLAGHVAEIPSWGAHTLQLEVLVIEPGQKAFQPKARAEVLEKFDSSVAEARPLIAGATDEDWAKIWTMKYGAQTIVAMPRSVVMRSMVMNHLIHHRAQLGVYLRLHEVEIPGMYGPSADEAKYWVA